MQPAHTTPQPPPDEPPPFLGTWAKIYRAVVLYLIAVITLFWIFSRSVRP